MKRVIARTAAALLAAVQGGREWMDHFNRKEYVPSFREYTSRFGPLYMEAVRAAGEAELTVLAEELLDGLEAGWRAQRFWNRSAVRTMEKQMMVTYLSPMLLGLEEPNCRRLAELLRDGWAVRWPKDAYGIADFKTIRGGFRNVILGVDIGSLNGALGDGGEEPE